MSALPRPKEKEDCDMAKIIWRNRLISSDV